MNLHAPQYDTASLPYKVAVLCYLWDADGRILMLHRKKVPNIDMYSPVGGKVEISRGESPHECAAREVEEETGLRLRVEDMRLFGMVSERAYQGEMHWLIFLFEATRPIGHDEVTAYEFDEGTLVWVPIADVASAGIPETDRTIMCPNVQAHRGGFFMVDIDCSGGAIEHRVVESWKAR